MILAWILILLPLAAFAYAYLFYPAVIWGIARFRGRPIPESDPADWPELTITLPAFNEERVIRGTLETLLDLDYPEPKRHIVVISDASSDGTDRIVQEYSGQDVTLLRLPTRGGKTAAENAAGAMLRGSLVVNTDATTRILPASVKALVRVFNDPAIGLASGHNVSVAWSSSAAAARTDSLGALVGESAYVSYEMWLRSLETRAGSIVGASGCFYAVRRELFDPQFPVALSRDFASALVTVEKGYRAVSVETAVCLVPRAGSLRVEFRRKVRTMARGLETLWFKRRLMNLRRYPLYGLMLASHKLVRWLALLFVPLGLAGLAWLAREAEWARWLLVGGGLLAAGGVAGLFWPPDKRVPGAIAALGFVVASTIAALIAWIKALRGEPNPAWEPTRRD